jgi:RimJ/RimL family protein N-acetyltransferase
MRHYKPLKNNIFSFGDYNIVPLRDEDKYAILDWRNSQIDILRQDRLLTKEEQENYFKTVISQLFEVDEPVQLLWSFLQNSKLIGYGGLVHIDWINKTGEISFLTETSRNKNKDVFINDWCNYLTMLIEVASRELKFNSIYTYAYDIRPNLYIALEKMGFKETKRIKNSIDINNELKDVVIHTFYFNNLKMRFAELMDADLYFKWANDRLVRKNSFNQTEIDLNQHVHWFKSKLNSEDCFFYLFFNEMDSAVGQVRIDKSGEEVVIGISIDENHRGKSLGTIMLNQACNDYLSKFPQADIIAYIKEENVASINQFSKAGFINMQSVKINDCKSYKFKKTRI